MQRCQLPLITAATDWPDGLAANEHHRVVRLSESWFSYTRKGMAIQFHIFSFEPKYLGLRCEQFIRWLFDNHEWCTMLIVTISKRKSLVRLAKKNGFSLVDSVDDNFFMMRLR